MRLSYVRVLVDNFSECFRFYKEVLGLESVFGESDGVYAEFKVGSETKLALFRRDLSDQAIGLAGAPGSTSQWRFSVVLEVDDVDARARQMQSRGAKAIAPPADRAEWGVRTAHFLDPDGNLIEINKPLPR